MILWSVIVVLITALDQLTKYWVINNIGLTDSICVIPNVIDFVYVKNPGAAFSFLSDATYGTIFLSIVSVVFCVLAIGFLIKHKPKNKLFLISLALMISGAIGNVIDRIVKGYVVDFIETKFIKFPVFNVADIAITIGAILLVIYILFFDKTKSNKKTEP